MLLAYRPVPPGEENPLADYVDDPRVKDVVRCSFPVVISSLSEDGITRSNSLAIVPYASGKIVLRRDHEGRAKIASHYFGGSVTHATASIDNGSVTVHAVSKAADGKPLEWIEMRIT